MLAPARVAVSIARTRGFAGGEFAHQRPGVTGAVRPGVLARLQGRSFDGMSLTGTNPENEPLFVDQDVRIHRGDAARTLLQRTNDVRFYEAGRGVVRVDQQRWSEAQRYERRTWMELGLRASDDRNRDHVARFREYRPLAGIRFKRAIELGCGPFTNLRYILEVALADRVHLLDPLIRDYVRHPLCRYRGGRLGGIPGPLTAARLLVSGHPLRQAREIVNAIRVGGVRGRPVQLEASAIEDFEPDGRFDLVVMINVIEHCRDVSLVFDKIDRLLEPGGFFVFHDRPWNEDHLQETMENLYDAGHPLRVGRNTVDDFLRTRFEALSREDVCEEDENDGIRLPRTSVYFIGRKQS
jgi:SAM-dependent methyltransferase